jgi:hypothetical protein
MPSYNSTTTGSNKMHDASIKTKIERLEAKLAAIQKRLQWIADEETKSAHINEPAHYFKDKDALLKKADIALDELKALFNKPWI